ncbi:MAG: 1-deoxy-D-xylulose-5-phosphate synthase [Candidatus Anammoxibacter sp.]
MSDKSVLIKEIMYPDYVKGLQLELLPQFCNELREKLIEIISETGGHIGVNAGIVELTVALYRIFDFPKDSLIWDIGHQIYIQKMITGRLNLLRQIRKNGGSPGYAFRAESEYDRVTSSHAGASISFGLGVAIANRLRKNELYSLAVIGDGALVEGSSQEAINHLAVETGKFLIVLNDNEMALDNNFGGLHEYLKKLQPSNNEKETYFKSLEIPYFGPVDGHDVIGLVKTLEKIRCDLKQPAILHVKTIKGKGLEKMANASPVRIHWNFPFDPKTGKNTEIPKAKSYAAFAGETIDDILKNDPESVLITPATLQNTSTYQAFCNNREKSFDVSLAEQHSITLAGGFALQGMKPIVCFEGTFLQRGFDQLLHDICINNLPVMIIVARSGHTGLDHITHHSLFDFSYLRCIPNLKIVFPATHKTLGPTIKEEYVNLKGPTLVLYPYGNILDDPSEEMLTDQNSIITKSKEAKGLILSVGTQNKNAVELKKLLNNEGKVFDHIAVTNIAPLMQRIVDHVQQYPNIVTMEEAVVDGGFGSSILEVLQKHDVLSRVLQIGFPKQFIEHSTRDYIYKKYNIDAASVLITIKERWSDIWL